MAMLVTTLDEVINRVRTGDHFFFGGRGISDWVEAWTHSDIGHVASALVEGRLIELVEALRHGMTLTSLRHRVAESFDCWYCPINRALPISLDAITAKALDVVGRHVEYDKRAIASYFIGRRPEPNEERLYCSEASALLDQYGGIYPGTISLTPIELARLQLYEPDYYCLAWDEADGGPKEIEGYNTVPVTPDVYIGLAPDLGRRRRRP